VNDPSGPPYRVELTNTAERALGKLDKPIARRIAVALAALKTNPRPSGVTALVGWPGTLRYRVGDSRIVYRIEDDQLIVLVLALGHRRDIYRDR
jgi:mRNA interferase RelE/StbE